MSPSFSGPRWWRRLPLAVQLATYTVSITIGWAVLSRALADRRDARATETRATSAVVARLETQVEALGLQMVTMQSAQRGFLLTRNEGLLDPYYVDADTNFTTLRDSALKLIQPFDEPRVAFDAWLEAFLRWRSEAASPNISLVRSGVPATDRRVQLGVELGRVMMDTAVASHSALRSALQRQAAIQAQLAADDLRADARELFLVRVAVLATILLLVVLITRTVREALNVVVDGAEALAGGEYARARIPTDAASSNAELARLATAFDQLSVAVSKRESTLQTEIVSLRDLEQMKTEFVSMVSHELRTPLTSVRGALGLVLGGSVGQIPEATQPLLRIALQNTERLVRLINDILDIEKMESARFEIRREPVDLRAAIDTTVAGIETFAREHGVELHVTGASSVRVIGDSDRLVQLFTNLISNAVKYSPRGETVAINVEEQEGRAFVSVSDRGPGIPEEFRSRIFGRFQQAAGTSGGTGLGLAIVQRITSLHGGHISFESAPKVGTVFRVVLPVASSTGRASLGATDGRARILLVEDDPSMADILAELARPYGHVITARTADDAMSAARKALVDVMILDPGLAGDSGFELVRRLRALDAYHALPVLVFSADDHDQHRFDDVGIPSAHVFVKSKHPEAAVVRRLRAVLAARGHG